MATSTITPQIMNTFTNNTLSKAVSKNTITEVGSISIPSGYWLVLTHMVLANSGTGVFNHYLATRVTRTTESAGGGSLNFIIMQGPSSALVRAYTTIDTTVNVEYSMIRLY